MQNETFNIAAYLYGFITVITLALLVICVNCYCMYKIMFKKVVECDCKNDSDESLPGLNDEASDLQNQNDDSVKESFL